MPQVMLLSIQLSLRVMRSVQPSGLSTTNDATINFRLPAKHVEVTGFHRITNNNYAAEH